MSKTCAVGDGAARIATCGGSGGEFFGAGILSGFEFFFFFVFFLVCLGFFWKGWVSFLKNVFLFFGVLLFGGFLKWFGGVFLLSFLGFNGGVLG